MTDPKQLIRELDASTIRTRLGELERERQALLVLLRAAKRAKPIQRNAMEAEGLPRCQAAGEGQE